MATTGSVEIELLPPAAADDAGLTAAVTELINDVYAVAEEGLWRPGSARTTIGRVADLVRTGEMAVARMRAKLVGCVRVQMLGQGVGEFGLLAVVPGLRGTGVGRDLVRFAENSARARECDTMQLEVLVPRDWSHPSKEFLIGWYTRIGYQRKGVGAIEESYPELAPLLATPCDYVIYQKRLGS